MRHTLFAVAAATALASAPARATTPVDTYQGNLSILALDSGGNVIPMSSMTPGNIVATSGWVINTVQILNGSKTTSTAYCGLATTGVNTSLTAAALTNVTCGDGSAPVATFGGPAFAPAFTATCSYASGDWTSLYYSPTNDVVHMPKQNSACNGNTNITQKFHNGGSAANFEVIEVEAAYSVYTAGIITVGSFNVSNTFPGTLYNPAQQPVRPDMAAAVNAQRLVNYNNALQQ